MTTNHTTLPICQLGNPILRSRANPVTNVLDESVQSSIERLMSVLSASNGVGIAAPQLGRSLQIIVVASRPNPRYPHAPYMEPVVMINPWLESCSNELVKDWEGCLSIPGIRGLVPRYQAIEVGYTNCQGQVEHRRFTDFIARVFQHEYDHLSGKVFLDRVESSLEIVTEEEYLKLVQTS
ncbi:peptide deformylase [Pseudanabaena sp. PCC 6802]|uniref:peptide deformylase n=1 Tax=Pseudanabaena sp. PCC 6802 TaxID=118173 RepID=UPI0003468F04|nr:peptide deformylase [Pseudanabaena sp. PCC 6802]